MTADTTGCELELFAEAHAWKAYFGERLRPWIRGDVAEIGAGLGATSAVLATPGVESWTAVEPEPELFASLAAAPPQLPNEIVAQVRHGIVTDLEVGSYDTLVYIDVLEHIADDRAEVIHAVSRLRPGGHLVTLSPAHQWLMTDFDRAIGHHRRYGRRALEALTPPGASLQALFFLDSVGVCLSGANRAILRQSMPTAAQIALWNKRIVPLSRRLDALTRYRWGKSVCAVWRRDQVASR